MEHVASHNTTNAAGVVMVSLCDTYGYGGVVNRSIGIKTRWPLALLNWMAVNKQMFSLSYKLFFCCAAGQTEILYLWKMSWDDVFSMGLTHWQMIERTKACPSLLHNAIRTSRAETISTVDEIIHQLFTRQSQTTAVQLVFPHNFQNGTVTSFTRTQLARVYSQPSNLQGQKQNYYILASN